MRASSACRSCGAPIRWGKFRASGRRVPLDAAPADNGNLAVVGWEAETTAFPIPVVSLGDHDDAVTRYRYVSHFATCPNANDHRKEKR